MIKSGNRDKKYDGKRAELIKILKRGGAVIGYLFLLSIFFGFQITKLFDGKQFLLLLLGTGILMIPSLGQGAQEGGERIRRHISSCALWASFLESFLLCLMAMEHMGRAEEIMPEIALCLRPILYGVCIFSIFEEEKAEGREKERKAEGSFREITASESYAIFQSLGLTGRECEIAVLVCQGMSNGEIAENLCISEATVKKHLSNMFGKLGCERREQVRLKLFQ